MDAHDPPHLKFNFDNSFVRSLEGFFVSCQAEPAITPKLLQFNHALAAELGLDPIALDSEAGVAIFSGNVIPEGSEPIAQAYAGHQFGGFAAQLGMDAHFFSVRLLILDSGGAMFSLKDRGAPRSLAAEMERLPWDRCCVNT